MYKPLPKQLTIKKSPIEGLGLYATENIKKNSYIGVTHVRDEQFENKYIRTPVGGFYNHSNQPNVIRMVSDILPKLKFGDLIDAKSNTTEEKDKKTSLEDVFFHLQEKSDAKYNEYMKTRAKKKLSKLLIPLVEHRLYRFPDGLRIKQVRKSFYQGINK